jgi:DNA polymerase-4
MPKTQWKYILHADMDAFYASVEQMDNPAFKNKPLVVGGSASSRGVVAAASYEARKYGIRSAMPMKTAFNLYPNLIRLSPRFDRYREISNEIMTLFKRLTPLVESLSLDEAYIDISKQVPRDSIKEVATGLRETVKENTGLAITIGGGTSKTVAKIASQIAKPDGLLLVAKGFEKKFLEPLKVELLWGVGPKTKDILAKYNIQTIGDITKLEPLIIHQLLGKRGLELAGRATGTDDSKVTPFRETKSISSETTLQTDTSDFNFLERKLNELSKELSDKLIEAHIKSKTISLKLRLSDFTTFTRQMTFVSHTDNQDILLGAAKELLKREIKPDIQFRLIGLGVSSLQESFQLSLFDNND